MNGFWKRMMLLIGGLLLFGAVAFAQTDAEVNSGIQFNFSTPGARSLALGGAFLGLADDATAAYTNPAGLTVLSKPEVSIEGRRWNFTNEFTDRGHLYGAATGGSTFDNINGLVTGQSSTSTNGLSYLSIVYPHQRWALALYRHELANFETMFRSQGPYYGDTSQGLLPGRFYPVIAGLDLKIVNLGLSGAVRVSDKLSLGLGISSYDFTLNSVTHRFYIISDGTEVGGRLGPPLFDDSNIVNIQEQSGDGRSTGLNLGFRWSPTSKLSIGGVYRQGPEFDLDTKNIYGVVFGDQAGKIFAQNRGKFRVPDVYGLGFALRPRDAMTITFDYDRVKYSSLAKNSFDVFFPSSDSSADAVSYRAEAKRLAVDDANEFHLGVEYILINMRFPLALRAGSWYDPDHKLYFKGNQAIDDQDFAVFFRKGDNEIHYSAGLGFVFGEKFQLDAAYDHSKLIDTASLSAVFRF